MDVEKLVAIGTQLGLSGLELRQWIDAQRAEQRAERAAEREALREAAERERERRRESAEIAKEAAEREREERREAAEIAKDAAEREMRILELKIRLQEGSQSTNAVTSWNEVDPNVPVVNPQKLLPLFDERRDDLHAYLQRFERVATGQGWPQDKWAVGLSMCLSGEALTVMGRMTAEESLDYTKVKKALLQRFRFTAQGYQEKFRKARAEDGETGRQFAARLSSYFDHWVEMANIPKTFEGLRDLLISEQFYCCCHPKLMVFLKERECATLSVLADVTDRFLEAQSLANLGNAPTDAPDVTRGAANTPTPRKAMQNCCVCDRPEHRARDCRTVIREHENCSKYNRPGHSSDNCGSGSGDKVIACTVYEPPRKAVKTAPLPTKLCNVPASSCAHFNRARLPQEQHKDHTLRSCYRKVGRESRSARGHRYTFFESEGLLFRECRFAAGKTLKQMVVPKVFREFIIRAAHEHVTTRHAGIRKTAQRIFEEFYWPDLNNDVKRFVRSCHICSRRITALEGAASCTLNEMEDSKQVTSTV